MDSYLIFENFPVEIMEEIFYYLPSDELHRCFFNLNSRINLILSGFKWKVECFIQNQNYLHHNVLPYYFEQIYYLNMCDKNLSRLELHKFINLRSLTVSVVSCKINDNLSSSLSMLKHLEILQLMCSGPIYVNCSLLFSCPTLKRLKTSCLYHNNSVHPLTSQSNLEYLHLHCSCALEHNFIPVLHYTPKLRRLNLYLKRLYNKPITNQSFVSSITSLKLTVSSSNDLKQVE
ncbi:unnamed protein product, partial [Didymodactylos carnosus]